LDLVDGWAQRVRAWVGGTSGLAAPAGRQVGREGDDTVILIVFFSSTAAQEHICYNKNK
jgi:hypothetical protein